MRNYSVRTTFKYPSSDREISEVAGRAQEDEGRREKTSGWRAEKKEERTRGTAKAEEKEEEKKGRTGYNSTSGSPEISISWWKRVLARASEILVSRDVIIRRRRTIL